MTQMNKLTDGKTLCLGMKGIHCVKRKEDATHSKMKDEGNEENLLLSSMSIRLGIYLTRLDYIDLLESQLGQEGQSIIPIQQRRPGNSSEILNFKYNASWDGVALATMVYICQESHHSRSRSSEEKPTYLGAGPDLDVERSESHSTGWRGA
ncbi:NDR1/HIN1-like 1 [Striga asiatica]|uniref:NDR1/HIN1-like 1 n=1 Tax=Striga asiatica TaxID=4170 RepID=A0A5A7QNV9_STRAF|nr:NDR1/HIN1-like 1 [Striga asiatica]